MGSLFRADTQLRKSVVQPDVPPKAASLTLWFVKSRTAVPAGKRTVYIIYAHTVHEVADKQWEQGGAEGAPLSDSNIAIYLVWVTTAGANNRLCSLIHQGAFLSKQCLRGHYLRHCGAPRPCSCQNKYGQQSLKCWRRSAQTIEVPGACIRLRWFTVEPRLRDTPQQRTPTI